jgi:hypothetical protein
MGEHGVEMLLRSVTQLGDTAASSGSSVRLAARGSAPAATTVAQQQQPAWPGGGGGGHHGEEKGEGAPVLGKEEEGELQGAGVRSREQGEGAGRRREEQGEGAGRRREEQGEGAGQASEREEPRRRAEGADFFPFSRARQGGELAVMQAARASEVASSGECQATRHCSLSLSPFLL